MFSLKMVLHLSDADVADIEESAVYFNLVPAPAAQSILNQSLPKGAKIITIDTNMTKRFSTRELTAIILHELGHALNPGKSGMDGEHTADDYAVAKGFKEEIVSSLEKAIQNDPQNFDNDSTLKRIERLKIQGLHNPLIK
jgi:hypothetical protein